MTQATLQRTSGKDARQCWGRRDEEYIADFCLVAKRTLTASDYRIFKFHFLLGADWKMCCRQLNLERGIFFHTIYRIQQNLGLVFRELEPYGLFPLDEYFGGTIQKALPEGYCQLQVVPFPATPAPARRRLEVPIRKVA